MLTLLFALLAPAVVQPPCPGGGDWNGAAPPDGAGYYCVQHRNGHTEKQGWSVLFDQSTGRKLEECQYKDGLRDGRCTHYDAGGRVMHRGFYRADALVHYQFFWDVLQKTPADPLADRHAEVQGLLEGVGAQSPDASALASYVLEHYDVPVVDIRFAKQMCSPSVCASAGRTGDRNVIAIEIAPSSDKVSADAAVLGALQSRDAERRATEAKAAEAQRVVNARAQRKRAAVYKKAKASYTGRLRSWSMTHLRCNDGSSSPSCTCGRGSYQGCCSHHGGVDGCPRDMPEEPTAPD